MVASDVMDEARKVYLNDTAASLYTNTALIPHLSAAYDELQQELEENGASQLKEISTTISVTALAVTLTLPADFVAPIKLEERGVGETVWTPMEELPWEPSTTQTSILRYWNYREDEVKFLGATVAREVKLFYWKSLTAITAAGTTVSIINSKRFLALRTSATAATFIGQNPILGDRLGREADEALGKIVNRNIRKQQGMPVRRRPFGWRRRKQFYVQGS